MASNPVLVRKDNEVLDAAIVAQRLATLRASIIVPTRDRAAMVRELLASIDVQDWDMNRLEVVVVNDGGADDTANVAEERHPYAVRVQSQVNQGSAAARNAGAAHAMGNLLLFVDDDMLLDSGYVTGVAQQHARFDHIVSMGSERSYVDPTATSFARLLTRQGGARVQFVDAFVDFQRCVTNNLAVRKEDFEQIGRMQDVAGDGPTLWGDIDFGYRAHRLGYQFRVSAKAACVHRDHATRDLATATARAEHIARLAGPLFLRYPELLDEIPMFQDKRPIKWGRDGPRLVARKLLRGASATRLGLGILAGSARLFESVPSAERLLVPLYRWVIGAHHYRGFRARDSTAGDAGAQPGVAT